MAIGCTPRELLARVTTEEIAEAMAWERIEPFGSLHFEMVIGQVCATFANLHRDPAKRPEPYLPRDFMAPLDRALADAPPAEPIFVEDPKALSDLIRKHVFKVQG